MGALTIILGGNSSPQDLGTSCVLEETRMNGYHAKSRGGMSPRKRDMFLLGAKSRWKGGHMGGGVSRLWRRPEKGGLGKDNER